ncbi:MAG: penicillin-binding transpeptidase domain-containing protein [Nitrospira sp.]|nr:penicillin-binding transpeptidase domain-containing protein [Nitrospira sp.]
MGQKWRQYQNMQKKGRRIKGKTAFILLCSVFIILFAAGSPFLSTSTTPSQKLNYTIEENNLRIKFDGNNIHMDGTTFPSSLGEKKDDRYTRSFGKDGQVTYTIDPVLQEKMTELFQKFQVPYGAFVAINPKTGKVLAMVEYSEESKGPQHLALRATYPAASIFKLVTGAAALEKGKADPETVINFSGAFYSLTPRNWKDNPRRDKNKITLADALGKSCNVAFAKVALRWLSSRDLTRYAEKFGFNKPLDFEFPVQTSKIHAENTESSLAKTAAGFGDVTLSPLHGVMIASAIANNGKMMAPRIIDRVSVNGRDIYNFKSKELYQSISNETAEKLKYMMTKTIEKGTSRHAFHTPSGESYLKDITVGGKTGSLDGTNPKGEYSWFVGMAPIDDPEIAVAVLVINKPVWKIKAPYIAREGLLTYFNRDKLKVASLK